MLKIKFSIFSCELNMFKLKGGWTLIVIVQSHYQLLIFSLPHVKYFCHMMSFPNGHERDHLKASVYEVRHTTHSNENVLGVCVFQLKLDLCSTGEGPVDSGGGVFVMYNYARLATLQDKFKQTVEEGNSCRPLYLIFLSLFAC